MEPRIKDGRALVWRSHDIPKTATSESDEQTGKLFGRDHEILGLLNVGPFPLFFLVEFMLKGCSRKGTSLPCALVPVSQAGN